MIPMKPDLWLRIIAFVLILTFPSAIHSHNNVPGPDLSHPPISSTTFWCRDT